MAVYGEKKWSQPADSVLEGRHVVIDERQPSSSMYFEENELDPSTVYLIRVVDCTGKVYNKYLHKFPTFRKILISFRVYMTRKSEAKEE